MPSAVNLNYCVTTNKRLFPYAETLHFWDSGRGGVRGAMIVLFKVYLCLWLGELILYYNPISFISVMVLTAWARYIFIFISHCYIAMICTFFWSPCSKGSYYAWYKWCSWLFDNTGPPTTLPWTFTFRKDGVGMLLSDFLLTPIVWHNIKVLHNSNDWYFGSLFWGNCSTAQTIFMFLDYDHGGFAEKWWQFW